MLHRTDDEPFWRRLGVIQSGHRDPVYDTGFILDYVFANTHWAIRIVGRPRTTYPVVAPLVHILPGNYVCVARGHEPRSFSQTLARSWQWMRGYSIFTHTGRFQEFSGPVDVPDYFRVPARFRNAA